MSTYKCGRVLGRESLPLPALDARARNLLLVTEWEADDPMVVCTPHGNVHVSSKLLAQGYEDGREFVKALLAAADRSWQAETQRPDA